MRAKALVALVLGLLLLLVGAATASAGSGPVPMSGQVVADQRSQQVQLTATSTDGAGWRLQAVLVPQGFERGATRDSFILDLQGQFTLIGASVPPINGEAAGRVNSSGNGSLTLQPSSGGTAFQASFSSDDNGNLSLALTGPLPAPAAAGGSGTTSTAPAQPVNHDFWYLSRAAGFTAYLLLFLNVALGLGMTSKSSDSILMRWRVFDLHQFTALVAIAVLGLHIFSLLGDRYFNFSILQLLVPFATPYRASWTALGVIGFYSLLVITASFYVRKYIGYRTWRVIHYVTFGTFAIAMVHGVLAGTDTSQPWAQLVYVTTGLVIAVFTVYRFAAAKKPAGAAAKGRDAARRAAKAEVE